jgi:hypothetical protein
MYSELTRPNLPYLELLGSINQDHIVNAYKLAGHKEQKELNKQIDKISDAYPGGLRAYHQNAIKLLKESALGINPYADYEIGKPQGISISYSNL